jgi:hypothetical protein
LGGGSLWVALSTLSDKSLWKQGSHGTDDQFCHGYPKGVLPSGTEAAWDDSYAKAMGLPLDKIDFGDRENRLNTVSFMKILMPFAVSKRR